MVRASGSADSEVGTGEPAGFAASDFATSLPGAARELQWELGIQAHGGSRLKESSGCLALKTPASDAATAAPMKEIGGWDGQAGGILAEDEGAVEGTIVGGRRGEDGGQVDAPSREILAHAGGSADSEVGTGEPVVFAASDLAASMMSAAREVRPELDTDVATSTPMDAESDGQGAAEEATAMLNKPMNATAKRRRMGAVEEQVADDTAGKVATE